MKNKKIRVLLVEDDKVDQMAFERCIKSENLAYDYTIAGSIAEAKKIIKSESFDVIIADYMLGDGTSFELLNQFKEYPIIILTGTGNQEIAVEAMKLGASDYLIKDTEGKHFKTLPFTVGLALKRIQTEKKLQNYQKRLESMVKQRTAQLEAEIIERKRTEETLQIERDNLHNIFEAMEDGIYMVNQKYDIQYVNPVLAQDFGCYEGRKCYEYFNDRDEICPWCKNQDVWAGKTVRWEWYSFKNEKTYDLIDTPVMLSDGSIGKLEIFRDITNRKKAEEERERLMSAIEQASEIILISDSQGVIQYVNPALERITGYKRAEVIGQNSRILKSGEHDDAFYKEMWDTLLRGDTWSGRFINKKKDGTLYTEEAAISPVRDTSGRTVNYVAVKRDITGELKLEEQLRQAKKMESVGRLAGGVAHDFNNMLGVILGYAEIALGHIDSAELLHSDLEEIWKAAQRSADITQQLLAFARKQTIAPRVLDLNKTVEGMLKMLRRLIGEDIDFAWLPREEVWPIKVDPSQINQVLANLCVNARDAIGDVGKITIEIGNATLDEAYCAGHPEFSTGEYVLLSVSDNGCGMDKETLERLYEPFFTTKEIGKGTGLGLATVYGIVKQNSGFINVYSEVGQGTTFNIYLPRHAGKAAQEQKEGPTEAAKRGHETVLLVEDETAILEMITMMLKGQGYTVLAASTPGEAIHLTEEHAGEIQLLMTDVIMPEMNGRDLAKNLLSLYPNLKCLFMSGYTANVIAHYGVLVEGVQFIQKPFTNRDLAVKMREVLDSK